jgi:hypothetical protein
VPPAHVLPFEHAASAPTHVLAIGSQQAVLLVHAPEQQGLPTVPHGTHVAVAPIPLSIDRTVWHASPVLHPTVSNPESNETQHGSPFAPHGVHVGMPEAVVLHVRPEWHPIVPQQGCFRAPQFTSASDASGGIVIMCPESCMAGGLEVEH